MNYFDRVVCALYFQVLLHRSKLCLLLTVHFHFTEGIQSVIRIPLRILPVSSRVVEDDVSPVVRTGNVDRIRYCGYGVVGVPKTQYSILFVCCVGDVDRESQEHPSESIVLI